MSAESNRHCFINQLQPGMKNVNTGFIVLDVGVPRKTSQGNEVRTIRIADHTGSINMSVWNDLGEFVSPSDIFRVRNGCTVVHKGCLAFSLPKSGEMLKTGEFLMAYSDHPDMSAYSAELDAKFPYRKGSPEVEKDDLGGAGSGHGCPGFSRSAPSTTTHHSAQAATRPHPYASHASASGQQRFPKRPGQPVHPIGSNRPPVRVDPSPASTAHRIY
ncbi:hypothetical protein AAVH_02086 [Aphelenchoides avenae]|nr:hypothetical protein AAVH_02086 [Aphelenchus avenae]